VSYVGSRRHDSVVIPDLSDEKSIRPNLVHDPMLIIDPSGPVAGKGMLQGLKLSGPLEWGMLDLLDQPVDAFENPSVGALPIQVIVPSMLGKDEFHTISLSKTQSGEDLLCKEVPSDLACLKSQRHQSLSSRSLPPPDSSSSTDSRSLRTFLGLLRR